mgnify:CR=1 FL=1
MSSKIKVELHVHTKYSYDCSISYKDLIAKCIQKNIDVVAVTDHNQIEGALRLQKIAPFKVIVGEEILSKEGEIIGLFLKKFIPSGLSMSQTIREIKHQGGFVYLPHPFDTTTRKTAIKGNSLVLNVDDIDIIEVFNGRTIKPWDNLKSERFANEKGKTMCIGSDAHTKYELGRNYIYIDNFSNQNGFLESLSSAKFKKSIVIPWVFLLTKYHRFMKKTFQINSLSNQTCDICGNDKARAIYKKRGIAKDKYYITDNSYGDHSQIVKCLDCNLLYCSPRDNDKKLVERYSDFVDPNYENERIARSKTHERVFKKIERLHQLPGKILDIGCATGTLLETAQRKGWQAVGVEPSKWASRIGKGKYGLDIIRGTLETAKLKEKSFDAVTCLDVIEHVSSPRKLLADIHKVLKKDGVLCLVTPDIGSLVSKLLGENWWHIRPDHIYYFNEETLSILLLSQGFKVEKISRYSWTFSLNYWVSRLQNKLPFIHGMLTLLNDEHFLTVNFYDSLEVYARKV